MSWYFGYNFFLLEILMDHIPEPPSLELVMEVSREQLRFIIFFSPYGKALAKDRQIPKILYSIDPRAAECFWETGEYVKDSFRKLIRVTFKDAKLAENVVATVCSRATVNNYHAKYPSIMCCPEAILEQVANWHKRRCIYHNSMAKLKISKTQPKEEEYEKNESYKENEDCAIRDTLEDNDEMVTMSVANVSPEKSLYKYKPTEDQIKKRHIRGAPEFGSKDYEHWYRRKFPMLKSDNDNKNN